MTFVHFKVRLFPTVAKRTFRRKMLSLTKSENALGEKMKGGSVDFSGLEWLSFSVAAFRDSVKPYHSISLQNPIFTVTNS